MIIVVLHKYINTMYDVHVHKYTNTLIHTQTHTYIHRHTRMLYFVW